MKKTLVSRPNASVAAMELGFDQILDREQHGAIDVIEQVQRRQQRQRGAGIEFGRGHRSRKYSTDPWADTGSDHND